MLAPFRKKTQKQPGQSDAHPPALARLTLHPNAAPPSPLGSSQKDRQAQLVIVCRPVALRVVHGGDLHFACS